MPRRPASASLKIRHNNVLGYFIEVAANHGELMTGSRRCKARFIHRQTMANAMRFTTTELADLEAKIASAADRALAIELAVFDALARGRRRRMPTRSAPSPRRSPCSTSPPALAAACRRRGLLPAGGRRLARLRDRGRPPSGGRAGAAAAAGRPVRRQRLRPVAAAGGEARPRSGCSPAPTWPASRPSCARTR